MTVAVPIVMVVHRSLLLLADPTQPGWLEWRSRDRNEGDGGGYGPGLTWVSQNRAGYGDGYCLATMKREEENFCFLGAL